MAISTHETRFVLTARDRTKGVIKGFQKDLRGVGRAVTGVQTQLIALVGVGGLGALAPGIVRTNAEFESLRASLKSVTGSAALGEDAFNNILKLAVQTPFAVRELAEAFNVLTGRGLEPSMEAMNDYGNIAAATNKSIDQVVQAVADAASGQFRRLEDFGINASKQGDQIEFSFKGITETVANNSEAILDYFSRLSKDNFGTAMADQMNTLQGAFSNMGDATDALFLRIGESGLNDLVMDITMNLIEFTNSLDEDRVRSFFNAISDGAGAVSEAWNAITWLQGNDMLEMWGRANPSQIGNSGMDGYKLGDFNRSGGNQDYLAHIKEMEQKYADKSEEQRERQTKVLEDIRDLTQENKLAVAG